MSEPSRSGGCFPIIFTLLAATFGSFMAAFSTSSLTLVSPTEIVTHISLAPVGIFTTDELQQASAVISKRLNGLGLSTATVEIIDDKAVLVGLPHVENSDDVIETLRARGLLEFVDFSEVPDIGSWTDREIITTGQGDHPISETASKNPITNAPFETVLTGEGVQSATSSLNQDFGGQWQVNIEFSDGAGKILGDYTSTHLGKPLGIVLDGKVLSIPIVQAEISTQAVIAGNFTEQETKRLAVQLGSGALPFEMQANRAIPLNGYIDGTIPTPTPAQTPTSTSALLVPFGALTPSEMEQTLSIMTKRLDDLGISGATVRTITDQTVSVELPLVENADDVLKTISAQGLLEFVDFSDVPDISALEGQLIITTGQAAYTFYPIDTKPAVNPITGKPFETILNGDGIVSASFSVDPQFDGQWQVTVNFSDEAGKILSDYTRTHIGKAMGIVLDRKVISVVIIKDQLSNQATITGNFTEQEAKDIAIELDSGTLPREIEIYSIQQS